MLEDMTPRTKGYLWSVAWFVTAPITFFLAMMVSTNAFFMIFVMLSVCGADCFMQYRVLKCPRCGNPIFRNGPFPFRWTPFVPSNCTRCGYPLNMTGEEAGKQSYSAPQGPDRNWLWVYPPHVYGSGDRGEEKKVDN